MREGLDPSRGVILQPHPFPHWASEPCLAEPIPSSIGLFFLVLVSLKLLILK